MSKSAHFYTNLIKHRIPLRKLIADERLFKKVPPNWFVVVADIQGSTKAVKSGLHNDINLAATGSIIAILNTIKKRGNFKVPYFFGGDGATFLLPSDLIDDCLHTLDVYSNRVSTQLNLKLRFGSVSVSEIYNSGYIIKLAKLRLNQYMTIPVVIGLGLKYAEKIVKETFSEKTSKLSSSELNLEGMECRWDLIRPEENDKKVICLLINTTDEKDQSKIFSRILKGIAIIIGELDERIPITTRRLKLDATINKIKKEMYARVGKYNLTYLVKNFLITSFGGFYFKFFKDGRAYLEKVTKLSDTIMIDGSINTVMHGTPEQIQRLINFLDKKEKDGIITYGIHTTYASILSCYVEDRLNNHIHFVDGTEGGYTTAAVMLKEKLK